MFFCFYWILFAVFIDPFSFVQDNWMSRRERTGVRGPVVGGDVRSEMGIRTLRAAIARQGRPSH